MSKYKFQTQNSTCAAHVQDMILTIIIQITKADFVVMINFLRWD